MSDLISRHDAINKCQERLYESALNNVGCECKADEVFADIAQNRIKIWLNEVPAAEPETNVDQHVQRIEYVKNVKRCRECKHFERMHETPVSSDGSYYTYVICTASKCQYEPKTEPNHVASFEKSTETKRCSKDTWTTEEVAEILARVLGDECACDFNGIDEWLPESCKYADTECPTPKEKHGCWIQFLVQGGAEMRGEQE